MLRNEYQGFYNKTQTNLGGVYERELFNGIKCN